MPDSTIHIAHDHRVIDDAFLSLGLGTIGRPKTSKTYCGKRVPFDFARKFPEGDCDDCVQRYTSERDALHKCLLDIKVCTAGFVRIHKQVNRLLVWFCHDYNGYHPQNIPETSNHARPTQVAD